LPVYIYEKRHYKKYEAGMVFKIKRKAGEILQRTLEAAVQCGKEQRTQGTILASTLMGVTDDGSPQTQQKYGRGPLVMERGGGAATTTIAGGPSQVRIIPSHLSRVDQTSTV
jgi:hypothetical protein